MEKKTWRLVEASAMVLFASQAVRVLLSMLFGQVYDASFDGEPATALVITAVLTAAMLFAPLLSPREPSRLATSMQVAAMAGALARIPLSVDVPLLRALCAIAVLAAANVYLTGLLTTRSSLFFPTLCAGVFVDQLLRALGHTYDLGLRSWWLAVQVPMSLALIVLARRLHRSEPAEAMPNSVPDGAGFWTGISYGASLFLLASLLALPNAGARWTNGSYLLMALAGMLASALPLVRRLAAELVEGLLGGSTAARLLGLLLVLLGIFLADRGDAGSSPLALLEAIFLFWLLLPHALHGREGRLRLGMVLGMVLFLLLSISHVLSFTHAYTLATFDGAGLPTFLIAAILALGPGLVRPARDGRLVAAVEALPRRWPVLAALALLVAGIVSLPPGSRLRPAVEEIGLGTYNIHYGYDTHWHLSLAEQARTIEASGADLVALQEVDTGRLTSFGVDHALWLGRRLGMQAIYLPTVEHTTGIALLSRVRIDAHDAMLLPSQAEPTGIIRATVDFGGQPLAAHATWLGLTSEERQRQLSAALSFMAEGRATLAGDLNATPDSPVAAMLRSAGFTDPFADPAFAAEPTSPAEGPVHRIDYVWLRGLEPTAAQVLPSIASDHRMVVVRAR